jgi:hypothetical protein
MTRRYAEAWEDDLRHALRGRHSGDQRKRAAYRNAALVCVRGVRWAREIDVRLHNAVERLAKERGL